MKNITYLWCLYLICTMQSAYVHSKDFAEIHQCYANEKSPGLAVLLTEKDKTIYKGAIGMADVNSATPLTSNTIFQIGSVTKQFTAAAILLLEQQGKLSINDPLIKFLPSYFNSPHSLPHSQLPSSKRKSAITIQQMLSHTSGLPNYLTNEETMKMAANFAPLDTVVAQLAKDKTIGSPGEQYQYSNTAYILLGKIIELASGKTYAQYLEENLFQPLGLHNTKVITPTTKLKIAKGHTQTSPDSGFTAPDKVDRSWIHAAGGIASTLKDVALWHKSLRQGKLLPTEKYQQMVAAATLNNGEKINYGFGFDIYPISNLHSISHQGMVPGYFSWMVYFPTQQVFGVALTNNDRLHPGPALLHLLGKQLGLLPPKVSLEPQEMKKYANKFVGSYQLEKDEIRKITFEDGTLYSQRGQNPKHPLIIRENNTVSFECESDHFVLTQTENNTPALQPVSLYFGKGEKAPRIE